MLLSHAWMNFREASWNKTQTLTFTGLLSCLLKEILFKCIHRFPPRLQSHHNLDHKCIKSRPWNLILLLLDAYVKINDAWICICSKFCCCRGPSFKSDQSSMEANQFSVAQHQDSAFITSCIGNLDPAVNSMDCSAVRIKPRSSSDKNAVNYRHLYFAWQPPSLLISWAAFIYLFTSTTACLSSLQWKIAAGSVQRDALLSWAHLYFRPS